MGNGILRQLCAAAVAVGFHAALGSAAGACVGDCNFDQTVEIDELITSVNIALGTEAIAACEGADGSLDDGVDIAELVAAVRNSLQGCGAERPEWRMLGGSLRRLFYNPRERAITRESAAGLIPKWRYQTGAIVSASPAVAWVELPEGLTQMVFASSWDGNIYALRADNGRSVWQFTTKPQPGVSYPNASSPTVLWLGGRQVVYVGGGMSMYCIDAATGALVWEFDAGTGCTTCGFPNPRERNEVESSPAVHDGLVYFGMDVNDTGEGKGGMYAVRADDGRLAWYFDLATGATCRPFPEDNIRRFDGYHTAEQLGLPENFLSTRPGCDFDRTGNACGNVWSSVSIDVRRGLLYTASSNCDTDDDPETIPPPPPMPPYDRALFALRLDGTAAWVWRPSEVDNEDLSFGGVPNLFEVEIGGAVREVVGIGNKDGTYYVVDRDGVNEINGVSAADPPEIRDPMLPYWKTNVVAGGSIGGIIASAAVVQPEGRVFFSTAVGTDLENIQKPSAHALELSDGAIAWQNPDVLPSFGGVTAVPGLAFMGTLAVAEINVFDSSDGTVLAKLDTKGQLGGAASIPAVTGGMLFVGGGVGEIGGRPEDCTFPFSAYCTANIDTPVSAFCLAGTPGCTDDPPCDDANPCTYDFRQDGTCQSEPAPNTLSCPFQGVPNSGMCRDGTCAEP